MKCCATDVVERCTPEDCQGVVGDVTKPRLPDEFGAIDDVNY